MKRFEVGKQYSVRSACDHNCIFSYTVTARTEKTLTVLSETGETKKLRINARSSEYFGAETVHPEGRYSMAPVLHA